MLLFFCVIFVRFLSYLKHSVGYKKINNYLPQVHILYRHNFPSVTILFYLWLDQCFLVEKRVDKRKKKLKIHIVVVKPIDTFLASPRIKNYIINKKNIVWKFDDIIIILYYSAFLNRIIRKKPVVRGTPLQY